MANFIKCTRRKTGPGQYTNFSTNFKGKTTRSYSTKMGGRTINKSYSDGKEKVTEYITCGTTGAVKRTTKTYGPPKVKKAKTRKSSSGRRRRSTSQNQGCAIFIPIFFLIGLTPFLFRGYI